MQRYLVPYLLADLLKVMVFIGGPRQVGKTVLSQQLGLQEFSQYEYFNYDVVERRRALLSKQWQRACPLIIFDELHKYPSWKNWIKGVYDSRPPEQQYLVTGSARLDGYRRGGDSLLGRYHYWSLHPFTLDELPSGVSSQEAYRRLLTVGGFPYPFLLNDEREARRWRRERFERVIKEDIRDLELIRHIQLMELFVDALQGRVGQLVVLSNMAQDLQISPKTAKHWLQLIERMYLAFAVYPLTGHIARAIQKPPKVYFYDNADVENDGGAKLENLVATHLLKRLEFIRDYHGFNCSLHYIRDKDGREVDFATVIDGKVHELIEVKTSDTEISASLKYYTDYLKPVRAIQLVGDLTKPFDQGNIHVTHPINYFKNPPWQSPQEKF